MAEDAAPTKDQYSFKNPTLVKVCIFMLVAGFLWGALPFIEKHTLNQSHMPTEYFAFWRFLFGAVAGIIFVAIYYRKELATIHKTTASWKSLGFAALCGVLNIITIITYLYVIRSTILKVSISYSIITGILLLTTTLLGYGLSKSSYPVLQRLGEKLQPIHYAGIGVLIVGIFMVGWDLKRVPIKGEVAHTAHPSTTPPVCPSHYEMKHSTGE